MLHTHIGLAFFLKISLKNTLLVKIRKIQVNDKEHYWANVSVAFGANNIDIIYLNGSTSHIFVWENNAGNKELIVVEHADVDSIVVRPEQPMDMWCGDETLRYTPYETKLIPTSEWIKPTGESRFNIIYTRGC